MRAENIPSTHSLFKLQSVALIVLLQRFLPILRCTLFLVFLISSTLALGIISFRAQRQKSRLLATVQEPAFILTFVLWIFIAAGAAVLLTAKQTPIAIVTADLVAAKSGPSDTFTELFKVTAGTKVEVTGESRDGWTQIRFSLGNVGWIMEKDLLTL